MHRAFIVSTARPPIGRICRGAFNDTQSQAFGRHVVAQAVRRAGVGPAELNVTGGGMGAAGLLEVA
jgi:acetyl-CoA C-acetyltransferase